MYDRGRGRKWFLLAGLFAGLYAVNVALRILFIKHEVSIWRLGDVGEFLLVLVAMALFVSGLFAIDGEPESSVVPTRSNHKEAAHEPTQD